MCSKCGHDIGTRHLLYWQWEWFKRFWLTWYHIVNRKAYYRFLRSKGRHPDQVAEKLLDHFAEIDRIGQGGPF